MTRRFNEAMRLMRRHEPHLQEDGFHLLLGHAAEHIDELIAEFGREEKRAAEYAWPQNDRGLRCWLLELIGEARSERAFELLVEQLHSSDESFRDWAVRGLELLGTKAARRALYQARSNGEIA